MSGFIFDAKRGVVIGKRGKPILGRNGSGYVRIRTPTGKDVGPAHRLLWESVHGPIPDGLQINHKNGIKHDNRIENLELVTPSENALHAFATGLMSAAGENNGRAKLTVDQARAIRSSTESTASLVRAYGVSKTTIKDIRSGQRWPDSAVAKNKRRNRGGE